jgi:hypothetical protein
MTSGEVDCPSLQELKMQARKVLDDQQPLAMHKGMEVSMVKRAIA